MGLYLGNGRIYGINVVAQTPDIVAQRRVKEWTRSIYS